AKGAKDARAAAYRTREVSLTWRDGKVENVSEATTRGVSVALYVDGRYASMSSNDLRPEALETLLSDSVAMARTLAVDSFRTLPEDGLYAASRFVSELPGAADLGRASTERALACIGAKKAESKVMTMVVENRVARRLVSALLGALSARSVQQKQSFLDGKIGS